MGRLPASRSEVQLHCPSAADVALAQRWHLTDGTDWHPRAQRLVAVATAEAQFRIQRTHDEK